MQKEFNNYILKIIPSIINYTISKNEITFIIPLKKLTQILTFFKWKTIPTRSSYSIYVRARTATNEWLSCFSL